MDTRALVEKQVEQIVMGQFTPEFMTKFNPFLKQFSETIIKQHEWYREIGYPLSMPPVVLDIKEPQTHLIRSLTDLVITREQNNKKPKWIFKKIVQALSFQQRSPSRLNAVIVRH